MNNQNCIKSWICYPSINAPQIIIVINSLILLVVSKLFGIYSRDRKTWGCSSVTEHLPHRPGFNPQNHKERNNMEIFSHGDSKQLVKLQSQM